MRNKNNVKEVFFRQVKKAKVGSIVDFDFSEMNVSVGYARVLITRLKEQTDMTATTRTVGGNTVVFRIS